MTRASEAVTDLICDLLDEAGEIGGAYYREHFPWQLEAAAGGIADLLALIYPAIDNLHQQQGGVVPTVRA